MDANTLRGVFRVPDAEDAAVLADLGGEMLALVSRAEQLDKTKGIDVPLVDAPGDEVAAADVL